MTPDTCPHCGAPAIDLLPLTYACGTWHYGGGDYGGQGDLCARYVRTRISHLRRMIQCAWGDWDRHFNTPKQDERIERFVAACLREIDRLRGGV